MHVIAIIGLLLLSGCINTDVYITPTNTQAAESLIGHDCQSIVFGVAVGTIAVDTARQAGLPIASDWMQPRDPKYPTKPIRNIRTIMLQDVYLLALGSRCLIVTGEP